MSKYPARKVTTGGVEFGIAGDVPRIIEAISIEPGMLRSPFARWASPTDQGTRQLLLPLTLTPPITCNPCTTDNSLATSGEKAPGISADHTHHPALDGPHRYTKGPLAAQLQVITLPVRLPFLLRHETREGEGTLGGLALCLQAGRHLRKCPSYKPAPPPPAWVLMQRARLL